MRRASLIFGTAAFLVTLFAAPGAAQEAQESQSFTGCLAQVEADDGQMEFVLQHISGEDVMVDQIELEAAEGVNMSPHVGHTVTVTGTAMHEEGEEEMELHVTNLQHVSASCEGGR